MTHTRGHYETVMASEDSSRASLWCCGSPMETSSSWLEGEQRGELHKCTRTHTGDSLRRTAEMIFILAQEVLVRSMSWIASMELETKCTALQQAQISQAKAAH